MKKLSILLLLLLLVVGATASASEPARKTRKEAQSGVNDARELRRMWRKGTKTERKIKPLTRPQLTVTLVKAARQQDSCWLIVKFDMPHRSIVRKEQMDVKIDLYFPENQEYYAYTQPLNNITITEESYPKKDDSPDAENKPRQELRTNRKQGQQLYYSSKFTLEPGMNPNVVLYVSRRLKQNDWNYYDYDRETFNIVWNTSPDAWRGSLSVREEDLLTKLPPDIIPDIR